MLSICIFSSINFHVPFTLRPYATACTNHESFIQSIGRKYSTFVGIIARRTVPMFDLHVAMQHDTWKKVETVVRLFNLLKFYLLQTTVPQGLYL